METLNLYGPCAVSASAHPEHGSNTHCFVLSASKPSQNEEKETFRNQYSWFYAETTPSYWGSPALGGTIGEGLHHNGTKSSERGGHRGDAIPVCSHMMAQTVLNLKCKQNSEAANSDATDFGGHGQSSS